MKKSTKNAITIKINYERGGYGVGLSMAKAIVENHKGEIAAYKKDESHIGFKVVL